MRLSEVLRAVDWKDFTDSFVVLGGDRPVFVALRDSDGCCPIVNALITKGHATQNADALELATGRGVRHGAALAAIRAADCSRPGVGWPVHHDPRHVKRAAVRLRRWMVAQVVAHIPGARLVRGPWLGPVGVELVRAAQPVR